MFIELTKTTCIEITMDLHYWGFWGGGNIFKCGKGDKKRLSIFGKFLCFDIEITIG